ncbi:MAG: AbrB/MazE/SpoVT family DNA-binding domain-containing protein [Thermoplasmatota archaeon]
MTEIDVTTMGERGQVVIPQGVRKTLGLGPKTKFVVYTEGDFILLKKLDIPDLEAEWAKVLRSFQRAKLTPSVVEKEVQAARRERRR